ncbi:MAG: hypothetical protein RR137_02650 [Odoribacter sp.]
MNKYISKKNNKNLSVYFKKTTSLSGMYLNIICTSICLLCYTDLGAQSVITNPKTYRDFNPWNEGTNTSGLIFNPTQAFSGIKTGYDFTNGNFRIAMDAPDIHRYHITSESYRQLKKIRLHGNIGYTLENKKRHQWNATLQPETHLINFGDTIAGRQRCETYYINGDIAIPLSQRWTIGGKLNYQALSNGKNTDPRNRNTQTDLLFSPGLLLSFAQWHTGANFIYHRINEKVTYSMVNQENQDIRTFYPLWFYFNENFQNGLNNTRLYKEEQIGGAVQFYQSNSRLKWFNEFSYTESTQLTDININKNDRAGETEHLELAYRGSLRLLSKLCHTIKPEYTHTSYINFDNLQGKFDNNGEQKQENYGRVKRSALFADQITLAYALSRPLDSLINIWTLHLRCGYRHEKSIFLIYPAQFSQPLNRTTCAVSYEHRIPIKKQLLEISTQIEYATGNGSLLKIKTKNDAPLPEIKIAQKTDLLLRDFQIKTAETIRIDLHLQYTYPINEKYAFFGYAEAEYTRGISSNCNDLHRLHLQLSTGLNF